MNYKGVFIFTAVVVLCCLTGIVRLRALEVKGAEKMSSKKYLVVYYSRTGNTKKVAQEVASRIGADIESITDRKKRSGFFGLISAGKDSVFKRKTVIDEPTKDPANYDMVIIGTPVWAGDMTPAARTYIERYSSKFKSIAFLITSGGGDNGPVAKSMEKLAGMGASGFIGFTGKELKDSALCAKKIEDFVSSIKK